MKLLTKLVVGIESALTTSIGAFWNTTTQIRNEQVYGPQDGPFNYHQIYTYQPLCIALLIIAGIIGFAYLYSMVTK